MKPKTSTEDSYALIQKELAAGRTHKEISKKYGHGRSWVSQVFAAYRRRHGGNTPPSDSLKKKRPPSAHFTELTHSDPDKVRLVARMLDYLNS